MAEPMSGYQTRPSLLLRLREPRDTQAWGTFVDVYGPLVYGHACRRGLRHQDAEDVTQKVFARIMEAIRTFTYQPDLGRFRDWLGTIVRNEINRFLKKDDRVDRAKGQTGSEDVLDNMISAEADTEWTAEFHAHVLQIALDKCQPHFEPATWHAFKLVWLENRSPAQVAKELDKPLDWVYVAKSRVLKQLWEEVLELADDSALPAQLNSRVGT